MSIFAANSPPPAPPVQKTPDVGQDARPADGDTLKPGIGRLTVKDGDGDYRPIPATASASVQAAVTDIKLGG
jgi:hypothetical protein